MENKATLWTVQATNKRNIKRENLGVANKKKPYEKQKLL